MVRRRRYRPASFLITLPTPVTKRNSRDCSERRRARSTAGRKLSRNVTDGARGIFDNNVRRRTISNVHTNSCR